MILETEPTNPQVNHLVMICVLTSALNPINQTRNTEEIPLVEGGWEG